MPWIEGIRPTTSPFKTKRLPDLSGSCVARIDTTRYITAFSVEKRDIVGDTEIIEAFATSNPGDMRPKRVKRILFVVGTQA